MARRNKTIDRSTALSHNDFYAVRHKPLHECTHTQIIQYLGNNYHMALILEGLVEHENRTIQLLEQASTNLTSNGNLAAQRILAAQSFVEAISDVGRHYTKLGKDMSKAKIPPRELLRALRAYTPPKPPKSTATLDGPVERKPIPTPTGPGHTTPHQRERI